MELTSVLRKAVDGEPGPDDAAVRDGAEALVRMLSCFAPFAAEEGWARLGHQPSVVEAGWPVAEAGLLTESIVTCVVQVDGKVRDRIDVPAEVTEDELRELALASSRVTAALAGAEVSRLIVRPPALVNVVTAR
jgi:leucyl-tRNA synthetase